MSRAPIGSLFAAGAGAGDATPDIDKTAVPSEASSERGEKQGSPEGVEESEHPVDVAGAKAEFETLRRTLSQHSSLHRVRTGEKDIEAHEEEDDFDLRDYLVCTGRAMFVLHARATYIISS